MTPPLFKMTTTKAYAIAACLFVFTALLALAAGYLVGGGWE